MLPPAVSIPPSGASSIGSAAGSSSAQPAQSVVPPSLEDLSPTQFHRSFIRPIERRHVELAPFLSKEPSLLSRLKNSLCCCFVSSTDGTLQEPLLETSDSASDSLVVAAGAVKSRSPLYISINVFQKIDHLLHPFSVSGKDEILPTSKMVKMVEQCVNLGKQTYLAVRSSDAARPATSPEAAFDLIWFLFAEAAQYAKNGDFRVGEMIIDDPDGHLYAYLGDCLQLNCYGVELNEPDQEPRIKAFEARFPDGRGHKHEVFLPNHYQAINFYQEKDSRALAIQLQPVGHASANPSLASRAKMHAEKFMHPTLEHKAGNIAYFSSALPVNVKAKFNALSDILGKESQLKLRPGLHHHQKSLEEFPTLSEIRDFVAQCKHQLAVEPKEAKQRLSHKLVTQRLEELETSIAKYPKDNIGNELRIDAKQLYALAQKQ